jgi:hypothetical protein
MRIRAHLRGWGYDMIQWTLFAGCVVWAVSHA